MLISCDSAFPLQQYYFGQLKPRGRSWWGLRSSCGSVLGCTSACIGQPLRRRGCLHLYCCTVQCIRPKVDVGATLKQTHAERRQKLECFVMHETAAQRGRANSFRQQDSVAPAPRVVKVRALVEKLSFRAACHRIIRHRLFRPFELVYDIRV